MLAVVALIRTAGIVTFAGRTPQQVSRLARFFAGGVTLVVGAAVMLGALFGTHTGDSGSTSPAWSPDGRWLAYVRYDTGGDSCHFSIHVREVSSGRERRIVDNSQRPSWSPDGKRIAFAFLAPRGTGIRRGGIAVVNSDGTDLRLLVGSDHVDSVWACSTVTLDDPSWSPDGKLIAFSDPLGLAEIRPDGTHRTQITFRDDFDPVWSPDGRRLAFLHPIDGDSNHVQLVVADKSGADPKVLTSFYGNAGSEVAGHISARAPIWSPKGNEIAYSDGGGIAVIPLIGGHPRYILECASKCFSALSWSPNGKQLAVSTSGDNEKVKIITLTPAERGD